MWNEIVLYNIIIYISKTKKCEKESINVERISHYKKYGHLKRDT